MAVAPLGRSQLAIDHTMQARVVVVPGRAIGGKGSPRSRSTSQRTVVIFGSPKTLAHSAKTGLVVMITLACS
jgi:hypothetical protein